MTSPTINYRIAEFLTQYLPFKMIEMERILGISAQVKIQYFAESEEIFGEASDLIGVIREGVVEINRSGKTIDLASEGDLVGTWELHPDKPTGYSAIAKEDALVYFVPVEILEEEILSNPKLALYFTSGISSLNRAIQQLDQSADPNNLQEQFFHLYRLADIDHPKGNQLTTCTLDYSIQEAAKSMTDHGVSSIVVVNKDHHPIGIITDRDLRVKVATGKVDISGKVEKVMSTPVMTIGEKSSLAEVHIAMVRHNIHHLCVTKDGTQTSELTGIITDTNLLLQQGNNPVVFVSRIKKAKDPETLKRIRDQTDGLVQQYLEKEVSISYVSRIVTEINDAIIRKSIEFALESLDNQPQGKFAWISLGSEGRQEQLIRTDQDNGLIHDDPDDKEVMIALAKKVNDLLFDVGFDYCPAEMMAGNPQWNLPLEEWKKVFSSWIQTPAPKQIMHSTIFFDLRAVFGEIEMESSLRSHILMEFEKNNLFLNYLAGNALKNPPPLGLFRNFILEKTGEHEDKFDIKARAIMPMVDAARVLCFANTSMEETNTYERFQHLASIEKNNRSLFQSAAEAYEWLLRIRAVSSFQNEDSGRYINLEDLNKWQRKNLKQTFRIIDDLQKIIETRFQLSYLRN